MTILTAEQVATKSSRWRWRHYADVTDLCDTIDSLRVQLLVSSMKTDADSAIEIANSSVTTTALKLHYIAVTGKHSGVFGGEEVEACAQAILALRTERDALRVALREVVVDARAGRLLDGREWNEFPVKV